MDTRTHVGKARIEKDLPPKTEVERRKSPRFLLNLPIEYSHLRSPNSYSCHSINASEGGLLICLQQRLEKGECINLKVYFQSGPNLLTIESVAQVMWVSEVKENGGEYHHGVRFVNITEQDLQQFKRFLDGLFMLG